MNLNSISSQATVALFHFKCDVVFRYNVPSAKGSYYFNIY